MSQRLIVVGADAAGMTAASQARRLKGPDDLAIVAFDRGNFSSYSACGIPYLVGGIVDEVDTLIARSPEEHAERGIEVRLRHEVVGVDLDAGRVSVRGPDGATITEGFDRLMLATGAVPVRPSIEGADAPGVFGIQTLDDGVAVLEALSGLDRGRAVVVGGGYIGLEMAEALVRRGIDTTLVEQASEPMRTFDDDMGRMISSALEDMGIRVLVDENVEGFEVAGGRVVGVATSTGSLPADLVVLGLGVEPNVGLARAASLDIGPTGAISVDIAMRTSHEGVWAAGDCVEKMHRVAQAPTVAPLGTHANKEGRVAGINIGGGYATFPGIVGTAVSKVCDLEVARTGLTEPEAAEAGFGYVTAAVDSTTRASYFPGATTMRTKLIAETTSGRLLGAQIVGREGAAKRIDVLATALWNEMGVDELQNVDLSYAPPFAPVWDPVAVAARKAWQAVEAQTGTREPGR